MEESGMTLAEEILQAVSVLVAQHSMYTFTRKDIRIQIGVEQNRWTRSYSPTFQAMRIDHPGGAPPIGKKYKGIFKRIKHGLYTLTDYGEELIGTPMQINKYRQMVRMYHDLEDKLHSIGQIIQFDKRNLETFGLGFYNILFLSCNLFEMCAKEVTERVTGNDSSDMGDWKTIQAILQFSTHQHRFIEMDYNIVPFKEFQNDELKDRKLQWWSAYNDVKHNLANIEHATLKNVINSVCAAGMMVNYIIATAIGLTPLKPSKLFTDLFIPVENSIR